MDATKEDIRGFLAQRRIAAGCPFLYLDPVDPFHRFIRWLLGVQGRLPM